MNETQIPFHRPMKLPEDKRKSIEKEIKKCCDSGMITNNLNVRKLEESIKDLYDVKYSIAVSSASQGLLLSLQSLVNLYDIPYQVNTQAFAWYSSAYSISTCYRIPVYQDIDPDTWTMEQNVDKYRLAMPVHTFGNVSRIESDFTIYDGAHALGSKIRDFGNATVISLAPTKIITSIEGGIILTDDTNMARYLTALRDRLSRMSEIHAIFGNAYLSRLDEVLKFKKEVFNYYKDNLNGIFQQTADSNNHTTIGMLTSLEMPDFIETKKYYEPLYKSKDLPNTEAVYRSIVCLPSYMNCPYKEITELINNWNENNERLEKRLQ